MSSRHPPHFTPPPPASLRHVQRVLGITDEELEQARASLVRQGLLPAEGSAPKKRTTRATSKPRRRKPRQPFTFNAPPATATAIRKAMGITAAETAETRASLVKLGLLPADDAPAPKKRTTRATSRPRRQQPRRPPPTH